MSWLSWRNQGLGTLGTLFVSAHLVDSGREQEGVECVCGGGGEYNLQSLVHIFSFSGINSDDKNLYLTASKKKATCCP